MRIFDFFAGGGCFSTAAAALEGVEVALGVDDWGVALSTFRRNHPGAAARGTTLPATWAALRLPLARGLELRAQLRLVSVGFALGERWVRVG